MLAFLYPKRFKIFISVQFAILFGSLFFAQDFYENKLLPILYLISILSGILMISKRKKLTYIVIALFILNAFIFGSSMISRREDTENMLIRLLIYFIFYIIVAWNIVQQVWKAKKVSEKVILGMMSGYISMGFLGFFLFMAVELTHPGAFAGIAIENTEVGTRYDNILYYSFITLLTIGYGEITPVIPIAQKAAILVGLVGQFYLVIVTGVIVGKYIEHSKR